MTVFVRCEDFIVTSNLLREGVHAMRDLGWAYPPADKCGELDLASRGFEQFLKGVTKMSNAAGKLEPDHAEVYVKDLVRDVEDYWPDVLRFLVSLGVQRKSRSSQIKFLLDKLSKFCPSFTECAPYAYFHYAPSAWRSESSLQTEYSPKPASSCSFFNMSKVAGNIDQVAHASKTPQTNEFWQWTRTRHAQEVDEACHIPRMDSYLSETSTEYSEPSQDAMVVKNGWRRATLWDRSSAGRREMAKLEDRAVVTVLDDDHGQYHAEYAKVQIVGWVKREYLVK